jgi:hypothetical protein
MLRKVAKKISIGLGYTYGNKSKIQHNHISCKAQTQVGKAYEAH